MLALPDGTKAAPDFKIEPDQAQEQSSDSVNSSSLVSEFIRPGGDGHDDFKMLPLYRVIVSHQISAAWWANRDALEALRQGAHLLIKILDLRVKDAEFLPVPLIRVESRNIKSIGRYSPEPDGYAIVGTICFNGDRLPGLPVAFVMAYLLKFLICSWRHHTGGDGSFDRRGRERLGSLGLRFDSNGDILIDPSGSFRSFLNSAGIDLPAAAAVPPPPRKGKETSKLWSCQCQRVRVGRKEFFARCTRCHSDFRPGDHVKFNWSDDAKAPSGQPVRCHLNQLVRRSS